MEAASAGSERRTDESAALDSPVHLWVPSPPLSRVFTIKKRTYQVCLECGREFEYSWASMHPVRSSVAVNRDAPRDTAEQAEGRRFEPIVIGHQQSQFFTCELSCSDTKVCTCHSLFC